MEHDQIKEHEQTVAHDQPVERYQLKERIGTGGVAEVLRATSTMPDGSKRTCAVKRLLPAFRDRAELRLRMQDEASIARRLHHDAIVEVFESFEVEGVLHIAMEYVDSVSVARLLARGAAGLFVPTPVCAFITHEVARALAYAHGAGVLHRDVSASNVLVSAAGDVKLTDFGLADADGRLSATAPGQVLGKWTYLSPHRRLGGPATAADDLYAVGVLLERLLSAADPRERARPNGRALQSLHRRLVDENHRPRTTQALELVTLLAATDIANREAVAHFLRLPPPRRAAGRPVIPEDSGAATAGGRSAPTRRRR